MKTVYPLDRNKHLTYSTPLFQIWTPPDQNSEKQLQYSILQVSGSESATESDEEEKFPSVEPSTRDDTDSIDNLNVSSPKSRASEEVSHQTESGLARNSPLPCTGEETLDRGTATLKSGSPAISEHASVQPSTRESHLPSSSRDEDQRFVTVKKRGKQGTQSTNDDGSRKSKSAEKRKGKGLCCPKQFQPLPSRHEQSSKPKRSRKRASNPYSKSKFVYDLSALFSSSDSVF